MNTPKSPIENAKQNETKTYETSSEINRAMFEVIANAIIQQYKERFGETDSEKYYRSRESGSGNRLMIGGAEIGFYVVEETEYADRQGPSLNPENDQVRYRIVILQKGSSNEELTGENIALRKENTVLKEDVAQIQSSFNALVQAVREGRAGEGDEDRIGS